MKAEDLYEAMQSVRPEFLEECEMYSSKRKLRRVLLIAAAVAISSIGVAAAVWSLREAAKADMGIAQPIPEWQEYEEVQTAEPAVQDDGALLDAVTLDATLCTGDQLDAYLRVRGVLPEEAAGLAARDGSYHWDIDDLDYRHSCALTLEPIAYEADTQTALVRLHIGGIEGVERVNVWLSLYEGPEPAFHYAPVEIPITPSEGLGAQVDYTLPQDRFPGEAHAVEARVYASYITVDFDISTVREIAGKAGWSGDEDRAFVAYSDALYDRVNEALSGASLQFRDGASVDIAKLPSPGDSAWHGGFGPGSPEELYTRNRVSYRYITRQAIDLSEVVSITIGGTAYPLA